MNDSRAESGRRILQVAVDAAGDVARQLCKGPATPAKVAIAAKKLACLVHVKDVALSTPDVLVAATLMSFEAECRELLWVRDQLTPMCGPLVLILRWLSTPVAQSQWQGEQGAATRQLLLQIIQVIALLLQRYPEDEPPAVREQVFEVHDGLVAALLDAGWLDVASHVARGLASYGTSTCDAKFATALEHISTSLLHVCSTLFDARQNLRYCCQQCGQMLASGVVQSLCAAVLTLHDAWLLEEMEAGTAGTVQATSAGNAAQHAAAGSSAQQAAAVNDTAQAAAAPASASNARRAALSSNTEPATAKAKSQLPANSRCSTPTISDTKAHNPPPLPPLEECRMAAEEAFAVVVYISGRLLQHNLPASAHGTTSMAANATPMRLTATPTTKGAAADPGAAAEPTRAAGAVLERSTTPAAPTVAPAAPASAAVSCAAIGASAALNSATSSPSSAPGMVAMLSPGGMLQLIQKTCSEALQGDFVLQLSVDVIAARLSELQKLTADALGVAAPPASTHRQRTLASQPVHLLPTSLPEIGQSMVVACTHLGKVQQLQRRWITEHSQCEVHRLNADWAMLLLTALLWVQKVEARGIVVALQETTDLLDMLHFQLLLLDDAQLTEVCQVIGPVLVDHFTCQCIPAPTMPRASSGRATAHFRMVQTVLLILLRASVSTEDMPDAPAEKGPAPTAAVAALLFANAGQLFIALEAALCHDPSYDQLVTVGVVLEEVLSRVSLVQLAAQDAVMSKALADLMLTYGKVLRHKALVEGLAGDSQHDPQPQTAPEEHMELAKGGGAAWAVCLVVAMCCCKAVRAFNHTMRAHEAAMAIGGQRQTEHTSSSHTTGSGSSNAGGNTNWNEGNSSHRGADAAHMPSNRSVLDDSMQNQAALTLIVLCRMGSPTAVVMDRLLSSPETATSELAARATECMHDALAVMCMTPVLHGVVEDVTNNSNGTMPAQLAYNSSSSTEEWQAAEAWECQRAWWRALLDMPLPARLQHGCHNPTCTNLQGASEAGLKTKLCKGCNIARFCSKACQFAAWRRHKLLCKQAAAAEAAGGGIASS